MGQGRFVRVPARAAACLCMLREGTCLYLAGEGKAKVRPGWEEAGGDTDRLKETPRL